MQKLDLGFEGKKLDVRRLACSSGFLWALYVCLLGGLGGFLEGSVCLIKGQCKV